MRGSKVEQLLSLGGRLDAPDKIEASTAKAFLENYPSDVAQTKLRKMLVFSYFHYGKEAGFVKYDEQRIIDFESFYKENIAKEYYRFMEVLDPKIFGYLGFGLKTVGKRVFRRYTIGDYGFFRIPESNRIKFLLNESEVALCFPDIALHWKKSEPT